ncbi:MAG: ParB/RepB/Spo0J family partition protein [Lachnospirales bacterium]
MKTQSNSKPIKKGSANKIALTPVVELLDLDDEFKNNSGYERVMYIPIEDLLDFQEHPFKVLNDEKMEETIESISERGVLMPIIARPKGSGKYEIISGHRRKYACEVLKIKTIPTIVRDLDDEESTIIMVDSNIQRENLLYSEKAFAFKMKLEAIKKQGKRTDLTSSQVGEKLTSVEKISENTEESARTIQRYIRLTELDKTFLEMVDNKKLAFNTGVELSYLTREEQEMLLNKIKELEIIPSMQQATKIKKYSNENSLNATVIDVILSENAEKPIQVTLKASNLNKYFPKDTTSKEIEETILKLLEEWQSKSEK